MSYVMISSHLKRWILRKLNSCDTLQLSKVIYIFDYLLVLLEAVSKNYEK